MKIYYECEGRIENSVQRIAVWHQETCRVMTNVDPMDGFLYTSLTSNNGFFFLLTTVFYCFKISFQKSLNTLRCNFKTGRHLNITMTSLDDNPHEFQYNNL